MTLPGSEGRSEEKMATNDITVHNRIVVTIDMCASTNILEDLRKGGHLRKMAAFLGRSMTFLRTAEKTFGFSTYKFTGDGWILLFPNDAGADRVLGAAKEFCIFFQKGSNRLIRPFLIRPYSLGISFGMACGRLYRFRVGKRKEYIGRALNLACRLQAALKEKDREPQYKGILSIALARRFRLGLQPFHPSKAFRPLRGIRGGGNYAGTKVLLINRTGGRRVRNDDQL
jgi:class 3 adenylate cyclase